MVVLRDEDLSPLPPPIEWGGGTRYTNTINLADGGVAMRPAVVNCYRGDLGSVATWWAAWRHFMFDAEVAVKARKGGGVETKRVRGGRGAWQGSLVEV